MAVNFKRVSTVLVGLLIGIFVGLMIPQAGLRSVLITVVDRLAGVEPVAEQMPTTPAAETHEDEAIVVLSKSAALNMGLLTTRVSTEQYQSYRSVPAIIRERPAVSELQISSPYRGVVTKVFAVPGQAVRANEALFELRLTDEDLAQTQSELLETIQKLENVDAKIARIAELASRGGTAKREITMLQLEKKNLQSEKHTHRQQLLVHGFSESQVDEVKKTGLLVQTTMIRVPQSVTDSEITPSDSGAVSRPDEWVYTIEDLSISPGATVQPGAVLCDVAWHASLYIEGQAFEDDVSLIREQMLAKNKVPVELGADDNPIRIANGRILYIDNRVDHNSQTFRFYLPLENEILGDTFDERQRRFRSWRFQPGQRGHVLLPEKVYDNCFALPPRAVTEDGNDAIVFRRLHAHGADTEYEAVNVHVLYRDSRSTIVAADGELKSGDRIVENRAYQLLLAMKADDGSGGHDHHGHSH